MFEQNNNIFSRRPLTNKMKSSTITIQRQTSGYIPSLSANNIRPLSTITNLSNNKNKRKSNELENDSFEYDVPTSNYASVRKQQPIKRIKQEQSITPKKKVPVEDGSMRLVTSTVQGMKHWASKHLPYPLLFEVFGKLDSQVTPLSSSYTRQFSLIDENDRIECIFVEMDQSFSNIDRDVQLRIICRFDNINNVARCVAIRVATKDEWHERRATIKRCDIQLNDDEINAKKQLIHLKKNLGGGKISKK